MHKIALGMLLTVDIAILVGCRDQTTEPVNTSAAVTPEQILGEMISAYQQAETYVDRGFVRLRYRQSGNWVHDDGKLSVTWARPNRLQLRAYQLTMTCNGDVLQAVVADPQSNDIDNQILHLDAPPELSLEHLYSDQLVQGTVARGMGGPPVQLELLLSDRPLEHLLTDEVAREKLEDDEIRGKKCYRVSAKLPEGELVLWIDRQNYLLRRMQYPAVALARQMAANDCSDVSLVAEFRDARFNTAIDESELQIPLTDDSRLVRQFVLPPQPLPSNLFGKIPDDFWFQDIKGDRVTKQSLPGTIQVLVWFNDHPACQVTIEQLKQVRQSMGEQDKVSFYAVCTEPTTYGNSELERLAAEWKMQMPLVRDLQAFGRDVFHIPWAPTVVVLDARGTVQIFETGANPNLAEQLPEVIDKLANGEDLAAAIVAQAEAEHAKYLRDVAAARITSEPGGDLRLGEPTGIRKSQ